MVARFDCVFAFVVVAHCLPTRQSTPEELGLKNSVIFSNLKVYNYEEILKELAKEDAESATDNVSEVDEDITKDEIAIVATADAPDTSANEDEEVVNEDEKLENLRAKRDVKDRTDIETIVSVKNNEIGTEKKYFFKTINRDVKGEKYKCKIGLTSGDVIFYYRCLLVSNGVIGEGLQETGQGDFFDIA